MTATENQLVPYSWKGKFFLNYYQALGFDLENKDEITTEKVLLLIKF